MYSLRYQRSWAAAFQLIIFRCLDSESCLWVPEQEWRVAFFFAEQAENNGWWEGREKCIDNCDRCPASALHWHFPSPSKTGSCWPWDVLVRAFFRNVAPRGGLNKIQKNLRRRPVRAQFKNTSLIHFDTHIFGRFKIWPKQDVSWERAQIWHKLSEAVNSPPVSDVTHTATIHYVDITLIPVSLHYSTHGHPLLTLA